MSSKKNRRKKDPQLPAFEHAPESIRGAWQRYLLLWGPESDTLPMRTRMLVTWQMLFALRWFVVPVLLAAAVLFFYLVVTR